MKSNKIKLAWNWYLFIALCTFLGCKKFIEVDAPVTSVNQGNVYANDNNAASVLTGIYAKMASSTLSLDLSTITDLSADNLALFDVNNIPPKLYYQNSLLATYQAGGAIPWIDLYSYVYVCNAAIEGLTQSETLSPNVKSRLLGEAYFLRGFYYFYLTNLYGNVPLVLTTDYSISSNLGNSNSTVIYSQIESDLKQSQNLLDNNYVDGSVTKITSERIRPNRATATALLARVYLYSSRFKDAETEASKLIQQSDLFVLSESLDDVFLKNSSETIWALQPVGSNVNTMEGNFFILNPDGPSGTNYVYLTDNLLSEVEKGDLRKTSWIDSIITANKIYYFAKKYKVKIGVPENATEYTMVFRLSEQYLIRAEARAQQGNLIGAEQDVNFIRRRARASASSDMPNPLPDLNPLLNKSQILDAIVHERRVELFTEWGNRWFDLKRTNRLDKIMTVYTPIKGGSGWQSYKSLFPIPRIEVQRNSKLTQNVGYN